MIHDKTESLKALPNIFVSREGHQVDGGEVSVHRYQIQTQKNSQNLNNEPHQRRAGLNAQDLWRKPEHKDREKSLTSENRVRLFACASFCGYFHGEKRHLFWLKL